MPVNKKKCCVVHKQRNVMNATPHRERKEVSMELSGIFKQEKKEDAVLNLAAFKAKYQGQSPREAFAQGMQLAGMRTHRLIHYSEEFLILTCPTTRTKYAKLDAARGVVINGLRYYHPLMRFSEEANKPVEVRYEPFDMSRAYAFVDGQWLPVR